MPGRPPGATKDRVSNPRRHEYIDALRGLAIVGVLAVHTAQTVPPANNLLRYTMLTGLRGVQLFYIASALTLCMSWTARQQHEFTPIRNFLLRRFFRIAPLFLVAIPVYLLIYGFGPRYWAPNGVKDWFIPATALLLHGFHPETINGIVPGSWSIAVEVTFYALFPIVIGSARTIRGLVSLLMVSAITYLLNCVFLAPAIAGFYPPEQRYLADAFANFNFLGQFPVFVFGMLLFHIMASEPSIRFVKFIVCAAAVMYLGTIAILPGEYAHAFVTNPIVAAPGLAILSGLLGMYPTRLLVNPLTTTLGKYSYGLYLCHWVVIEAFRHIGLVRCLDRGDAASMFFFIATLAAATAVAAMLYFGIEQPCIRIGNVLIRRIEPGISSRAAG